MLTIGQLATYAGVTMRAVRHYHQIGLLPEPERDEAGYRRYGAKAVVSLIRIRTLANAGVPLARIGQMLDADAATFAEAAERIDHQLREEIERLETSRKQIAQLAAGDNLALPPVVVAYLDRLRELGVSEPVVAAERAGGSCSPRAGPKASARSCRRSSPSSRTRGSSGSTGSSPRSAKAPPTWTTRGWRRSPT